MGRSSSHYSELRCSLESLIDFVIFFLFAKIRQSICEMVHSICLITEIAVHVCSCEYFLKISQNLQD